MKRTLKIIPIITFLIPGFLNAQNTLSGKWVKMGHSGPVALEFKSNSTVEVDFGADENIEVVTDYKTNGNTITFNDQEGVMCPENGQYVFEKNEYYLSFDLVDDMCNGRIKMTMGYWTKPNFEELLNKLSQKITDNKSAKLYLTRARIYMAVGKSNEAKADLDVYLEQNPDDAKALINRAGTCFPVDMEGALSDCNKAINLEPGNKNAYFLRGLARYEIGQKEEACKDFSKAIDLGFSILQIAEKQKCAEFWENQ